MRFALVVFGTWILVETMAWWANRCRDAGKRRRDFRAVFWLLRPLGVWAGLHALYRWQSGRAFTSPPGFPFYAHPWHPERTLAHVALHALSTPVIRFWILTSFAVFLLLLLLVYLAWKDRVSNGVRVCGYLLVLYGLTVALHLNLACIPGGASRPLDRADSFLRPWYNPGATFLYAMDHIERPGRFMRNFVELQPRLRTSIHGLSHPPYGSLSLYQIGRVMGVEGDRQADRIKYAIGLTLFQGLNIFPLYLLTASLFSSRKTGLMASTFWAALPLSTLYGTWAQNSLFLVFFVTAFWLIWKSVIPEKRPYVSMIALGVVFFYLTLLTYSWMIMTSIFAVFAVVHGIRHRRPLPEIAGRVIPPLTVMTLILAGTLLYYRLDYLLMLRNAFQYVGRFYRLKGPYQWTLGLLGGQLALALCLSPVVLSAFVAACRRAGRESEHRSALLLLQVTLGIYLIPILWVNALKFEAPRVWNWMAMLPLAFAVHHLVAVRKQWAMVVFAFTTAFLSAMLLQLVLDFAP